MIDMIRRLIYWVLLLFVCMGAHAQFRVTAHQEGWDRIPPQAQKDGFWFQQSVLANMDDDAAMEEVMLFGRDNGITLLSTCLSLLRDRG